MSPVIEKFLRYVKVDTQSSETTTTSPSTEKQKVLGRMLAEELREMGASSVYFDEQKGYVYAKIPATDGGVNKEVLGMIAHMDTSPDCSGADVRPRMVPAYDGKDILLNEEQGIYLRTSQFPELLDYVGQTLIVTDGTTLLGADDKAGVAEIMATAEYLLQHPDIKHGEIAIAFTPDEEIGEGMDHFDVERFGADVAYTIDGGGIGELEYENFNAATAKVQIYGVNVHPGEAKNKMKHAALIAMEVESLLPKVEKPMYTEGYEGFYHLTQMKGEVESAELTYILRDHDRDKFEQKKGVLLDIADFLNKKYGENTVRVFIQDSYYNMKEKIEPEYKYLVERVEKNMRALGITPKVQPIRGGTDGARLSFMGVPCPNICTGGHNYHGRFEYCVVESMEQIVKLLVKMVEE